MISSGILTSAPPVPAPSALPPVSSSRLFSVPAALSNSTFGSFAMHLSLASVVFPPQPSSPPAAFPSVQHAKVPEPVSSSTPLRELVTTSLSEIHARQKAEFVKLDEAFLAREDRVQELESSVVNSTSGKADYRSLVSALQDELATTLADLTASQSSIAMATSKLDKLHADDRRLTSQVLDLVSTTDSLRLPLSVSQASMSSASLDSFHGKRDRHLGLLRSSSGQTDRLDIDFTTMVIRAHDSRASLCRDVGLLFEEFGASADDDGVSKDAFLPPPTE